MSQNNGNSPSILVQLIVEVQKFTNGVKDALAAGVKIIDQQGKKIQDALSKAFGGKVSVDLTKALQLAVKQFDELTKKVDVAGKMVSQFGEKSRVASASQKQLVDAWAKINEIVEKTGVTVHKAAQQLIASGQAEVNAVVNVVAAHDKKILSYIEVGQAIRKLADAEEASRKKLAEETEETKKNADAKKNATNSSNIFAKALGNIGQGIASLVGGFGIIDIIRRLIELFTGATKAALDFAQANFTLAVQVGALQKVVGVQAGGSLSDWKQKIKELRQELKIFSETDITKAVTQTIVLTRSYKLSAEQQEKLIQISAALAKTTGTSLVEAADDLVKALGGSGVVLDKYGINLRDADKAAAAFELGFTDKLMKGTDSLTAQQLALATLAAVAKKADPIIASLGDNESSLIFSIKETDAAIADQTKNLGENFANIALFFKNVYLEFLDFVNKLVSDPTIVALFKVFSQLNAELEKERNFEAQGVGISQIPQASDYGLRINAPPSAAGMISGLIASGKLSDEELKKLLIGSEADKERFLEELHKFLDARNAAIKKANDDAEAEHRREERASAGEIPKNERAGGVFPGRPTLDPEMVAKFGKEILDLWNKFNDSLKKLSDDRTKDLEKANDDYEAELDDLALKNTRQLEDLANDIKQKNEDIALAYGRDVEKIDRDQAQKIEDIEKQSQDKQIQLTDDFYKKLRDLDNQYYFDLRDAVAENDAVAILKLQRKYNLDKQKLEENLNDRLNEETTSVDDRVKEIQDETQRRKEELDIRHQQELDDLQTFETRKREDIQLSQDRASIDLYNALQDRSQQIEDQYALEGQLLRDRYDQDIIDLGVKFGEEYDLTDQQLQKLAAKYDEYYGKDGIIDKILQDFDNRKNQLQGIEITPTYPTPNERSTATAISPNIEYDYMKNEYTVNITSDGSIAPEFLDAVVEYVADVVVDIVVQRGGVAMT